MIAASEIKITRAKESKISQVNFNDLPFGKYFTDYMLEADYANGEWKNLQILPYGPISFNPSLAALHYGQAIFEGIKAYKDREGNPFIFRLHDNFKRFNASALRMEMPTVPEEIFIEGIRQLVHLEKDWIPMKHDYSLYMRPFMFATDEVIGVKPSDTYKFLVILSPTGPYYAAPMRLYVEENYTRAAPGGIGFAKAAGNYGASMLPTAEAKRKGYDQVLWADAFEHKYLQEAGTMNVFFIIGNTAITPGLENGTILEGVTRDSVITMLNEMGLNVEERNISIDEVIAAYEAGTLKEVFGTGTAATISMVKELKYKDYVMEFKTESWQISPRVKTLLVDIREGRKPDTYGWLLKV